MNANAATIPASAAHGLTFRPIKLWKLINNKPAVESVQNFARPDTSPAIPANTGVQRGRAIQFCACGRGMA
jgi:hypothetical protein